MLLKYYTLSKTKRVHSFTSLVTNHLQLPLLASKVTRMMGTTCVEDQSFETVHNDLEKLLSRKN